MERHTIIGILWNKKHNLTLWELALRTEKGSINRGIRCNNYCTAALGKMANIPKIMVWMGGRELKEVEYEIRQNKFQWLIRLIYKYHESNAVSLLGVWKWCQHLHAPSSSIPIQYINKLLIFTSSHHNGPTLRVNG